MIPESKVPPHLLCERIAREAHKGQTRRDGDPYIWHPLRVAECFSSSEMKSAALLHDVIEDTNLEKLDLLRNGVPNKITDVVYLLTKQHPGTSYPEYIKRITESPAATLIKLAHMIDNLCDSPTEKQKEKYRSAAQVLIKALEKELSK